MALDLTELVICSRVENSFPKSHRFRRALRTQDRVYLASFDDIRKLQPEQRQKETTDFAIINYIDNFYFGSINAGAYYLRTPEDGTFSNYIGSVRTNGTYFEPRVTVDTMGVSPRLKLDLSKFLSLRANLPNGGAQIEKNSRGGGTSYVLQLGEYPKNKASDSTCVELERLFNGGSLLEGLEATGRWFTTNGKGSGIEPGDFVSHQNPEFVYGGEKYIRVRTKMTRRISASAHGSSIMDGEITWIKVEPISFVIKNWKDLPKEINPKGKGRAKFLELEAEDIILAGIPFASSERARHGDLWQNSLIRTFLNSEQFSQMNKNAEYSEFIACDWDFRDSGFLYQAFNLAREPIEEYTIPKHEEVICDYAFEGCVALKTLIIPSHVQGIGEGAFNGCCFKFAYYDKTSGNFILSHDMPRDLSQCVNLVSLDKIKKSILDFNYNLLLNVENLEKLQKISDFLVKNKTIVNSQTANMLMDSLNIDQFVEESNLRFFANELGFAIAEAKNCHPALESDLYKFAGLMGCFSTKKVKDKHGKETQVILAQKACSLLAQMLKQKVITLGDMGPLLKDVPLAYKPSQDFLKFIGLLGDNKKFVNLDMLLTLEKGYPGIFIKTMTDFERVKGFRVTIGAYGTPVTVPWADAIIKAYQANYYIGVTPENQDIANLFAGKGLEQSIFETAIRLRAEAKQGRVPSHILGKPLRECSILESIEQIRAHTQSQLLEAQALIDDLYAKKFTFEMLDKYDPKNAILGLYCSCCGSISSIYYGAQIAESSIVAKDVQNLVVRNTQGEIIAKGTIYVNKKLGYAVINDFELNDDYKDHEEGIGFYSVPEDSEEEQTRDMIFDAFMRGIHAFVEEYDLQHPECPIKFVNVGLGHNRLQLQCSRFAEATENLLVPSEYNFCDAEATQRVLYDRKKHMRQNAKTGGRE